MSTEQPEGSAGEPSNRDRLIGMTVEQVAEAVRREPVDALVAKYQKLRPSDRVRAVIRAERRREAREP